MILKDLLPRSLFGRSLLILMVPILLIQVVTIAVFVDRHWEKVTGRLSHAVAGEIAFVAAAIEGGADGDTMLGIFADIERYLDMRIRYDMDGRFVVDGANAPIGFFEGAFVRILIQKLEEEVARPFHVYADFEQKLVLVDVQLGQGVLHVELPERRLFSSSGYVFLLWVFGSSILLLMISVAFMRNQIRPIRKLAAAAKRFGQGRDVPDFKPSGAREVRQASQAFVDMHRRIKRQMEQRTMMLAGVSHDLRTPLTRMKLQLSMMEGTDAQDMRGDLEAMEAMVNGYLDFVRGEGEEQTRLTDLNDLIDALVGKSGRISHDIQDGMQAMIRPVAFSRCLSNIIENGLKYGENLWLQAFVNEDRRLLITVEDDGPGMADAEYNEVFKPFYRVDPSRNANTGGVGLGLSIAMDVVHAHGGRIWIEKSEAHGGLRLCLSVPV